MLKKLEAENEAEDKSKYVEKFDVEAEFGMDRHKHIHRDALETYKQHLMCNVPLQINRALFSRYHFPSTGNVIKLPDFSLDYFIDYCDQFYGPDLVKKRNLIMNPIPPQVGQLNFCIKREKSIMNRMNPKFHLYLENGLKEQHVRIVFAQKKMMAVNGYYSIQIDDKSTKRTSLCCLGKLRALNNERDKYALYDNGEAINSKQVARNKHNLRKEMGAFSFRYELCQVGNIRKMKLLLPQLLCTEIEPAHQEFYWGKVVNDKPEDEGKQELKIQYEFRTDDFQPRHESHSLHRLHEFNMIKNSDYAVDAEWYNDQFRMFTDKAPTWNPKCNAYVYNFRGRVSQASIKNF